MTPIHAIHIAYIVLALFGILLVLGRQSCKILVLLLGIHFIEEILNIFEEWNFSNDIYLITPALQLAYGPLYYLFAKNLIFGDIDIRKHLIHFLPTLLAVGFTQWWPLELMFAFTALVIYLMATYRLLYQHHSIVRELTANEESHSLRWLTNTLIIVGILETVNFIRLNLQLTLPAEILAQWYLISAFVSVLCAVYLVLKAIRQPQLYSGIANIERCIEIRQRKRSIPEHVDMEMAQVLFAEIMVHQHQTQGYRRAKYSLRDLSDEMGLTEQNLSWSINTGGKQSFCDFINKLRVDDIKQSLRQAGTNRNMLEIALAAGFNSKSSFNAVFKKHTGMTPSQYANQISE